MEQLIVVGRGHHFYPEVSNTAPSLCKLHCSFNKQFCYTIIL